MAIRPLIGCLVLLAAQNADSLDAQVRDSGLLPVPGGQIFYEVAGAGPAVLFMHDGLVHSAGWDNVFEALKESHTVIRFDRRGYGQSDTPESRYSLLGDISAVLDHVEADRVAIVGASGGGAIAINYALTYPARVSSLVLVGAVVTGYGFTEHFNERNRRNDEPLAQEDYDAALDNWINDAYLTAPDSREARRRMSEILSGLGEKHLTNPFQLADWTEPNAVLRLGELSLPTLVVVGESDIPDVHAHAGVLERGIQGSRRLVVSGAGHLVFLERPDVFTRLLRDFLRNPDREEEDATRLKC